MLADFISHETLVGQFCLGEGGYGLKKVVVIKRGYITKVRRLRVTIIHLARESHRHAKRQRKTFFM